MILAELHEAALAAGRRFPLTLGAKGSATIGGLVSTNAGGTQVLRFGPMRALVLGIEAVLPDGSLFEGLAPLKKDNRGYDLSQLLIGAEGTLGIVTAASLQAGARRSASARSPGSGSTRPRRRMELLRHLEATHGRGDRELRAGAEERARSGARACPRHARAARPGRTPGTCWSRRSRRWRRRARAELLYEALRSALETGLVEDATIAASEAQAEAFWRLRDSISEAEKKDGPAAKHDISVAVAAMPRFMTEAAAAVEARFPGTRVNAFGHLGDGNVHFNVRAPAGRRTRPGSRRRATRSPPSSTISSPRPAARSRPSTASAR